ncbi:MAG TPA: NADH-ubiquinone oxidoreductase-F iron-sulfur binding region domain-containing protein, partial [Oligoflexia bacterium]|nr:NADH-ubiquinone oxidoreductase-F iron-sulfur binding region domain-containing protein [Oligoflexia bacterium]
YSQLARILKERTAAEVCDIVEKSGLRGRGGGGFPTGKKWKIAAAAKTDPHYLICNADEGDPGAFMDRAVIEGDTYRLLEGMAISAYAIGARKAYVYIRAEYPLAIKRLQEAMAKAESYGLLGKNILGSSFSLEIKIKKGAGAFVCGEETALIHSIEGKRGMPRPRPPYPAVEGLFGKSTVINNVETLANVPDVIRLGSEGFSAFGTANSKGTKVFALSGMVSRTGLVEVPMGTSIREIVQIIGGGMSSGKRCKAVQMGGPSGGCIPEKHLDVQIDYESLKEYGAIMGSGGMVVMDESTCMVDLAKYFMEFIQSESCGKCIPCREGTKRLLEVLQAITKGRREETEIDTLLRFQGVMYLERLAKNIKEISLCGLGQTAPNPVLSTLRWFRDEYEAHIFERDCPAGACRSLTGAPCQNTCPAGTEVWRYVANIAKEEFQEAYRIIRMSNPLPSICARVCHHPCETNCRCGSTGGEPIAVRVLKRYVVDNVDPRTYKVDVKKAAPDAPHIAIVGAGPSGLTAMHWLSIMGYPVTVFEKESVPGGMAIGAIPAYRLPRDLLNREIETLCNRNTKIRYRETLGKDFTIDSLFAEGYKAVYVAIGAHLSQNLGLDGEDAEGVYPGIKFLNDFNLREQQYAKGDVGIIGGGNSAIDAARVALRQKPVKSVTVFYRRTEEEMPAYREEIAAAIAEGVKIVQLVAPVKILRKDGKLTGITLIKNQLGEKDASGRRAPEPLAGSEYDAALDTLIVAISETADGAALDGVERSNNGRIVVNPHTLETNRPGVFSGGDVVTGPNTIIDAVAAGRTAARMIDRYVRGKGLDVFEDKPLPEVYIEPIPFDEDAEGDVGRVHPPELPLQLRHKNFKEVERCITREDAVAEAKRCLRCDLQFTEACKN